MSGSLYIVATPIGHLEDITLRALKVLREADLIACEDTRQTAKLLERYGITTATISYHEHNQQRRSAELVERLKAGKNIALVSDAGAPLISDPGEVLIARAVAEEIQVVPVPGASALTTALMASGLPIERFLFVGFLPSKRTQRRTELEELKTIPYTLVFFEAPHRIEQAVEDMNEILGDRPAVLAREMTKIHEEFERSTLARLAEKLKAQPVKGEIVLLVSGAQMADESVQTLGVVSQVAELIEKYRLDPKTAVKMVADRRRLSKNEVYREYVASKR
jgi:16S rRNA (cytidine1402-2'-O)-methyltransferase